MTLIGNISKTGLVDLFFLLKHMLLTWEKLCRFLANVNRIKGVWRFLGFTSTLLGFITFAITPLFKKLLHITGFGIAILCTRYQGLFSDASHPTMACVKKQGIGSTRSFLVLMLTTVYSFIVDKMEGEGRGEMLDLISCGAFSFMSLSLVKIKWSCMGCLKFLHEFHIIRNQIF